MLKGGFIIFEFQKHEGFKESKYQYMVFTTLNNAIRHVITTDIYTSVPALPSGSQIIFHKKTHEGSQIEYL